jgi:outer membrane lipoprotein-sorting protein
MQKMNRYRKLLWMIFVIGIYTWFFTGVLAQDMSAEDILAALETSADTTVDSQFLLTGDITDADGTMYTLEIDVQLIPEEELIYAYIIQPDAIADNFIILDGDVVYNYQYLTNQVILLPADDPDALGGLLPADADVSVGNDSEQDFEFQLDLNMLFEGWQPSVEGYTSTPEGDAYVMRFDNVSEQEDMIIEYVQAQVIDGSLEGQAWAPYQLEFFGAGDAAGAAPVATLIFRDFVRNAALNPEDLRYLPPDAEIIDER